MIDVLINNVQKFNFVIVFKCLLMQIKKKFISLLMRMVECTLYEHIHISFVGATQKLVID